MSGNTIGRIFRVTTYGESHGIAAGGVIDGCPAGLALDMELIRRDLLRRKASAANFSTTRHEDDEPAFLSGIYEGITTGTPIAFMVENSKQQPEAYNQTRKLFRPGHGDYSWHMKYGHFDHRGGGRYSARETVARVVAGAIARQLISHSGVSVQAWVSGIGNVNLMGYGPFAPEDIEKSPLLCPDEEAALLMSREIDDAIANGDTLGGVITAVVNGAPPGLGEPVFDKVEAELAKAMLSIPSVKGFEIGEGFRAASMRGSEHNDTFSTDKNQQIITTTNLGGGTLGGITSGAPVTFRVAFKPVSSLRKPQQTVSHTGEASVIDLSPGRYDVCVVPRAVAVVEAMAAIVMADLLLRNRCAKR